MNIRRFCTAAVFSLVALVPGAAMADDAPAGNGGAGTESGADLAGRLVAAGQAGGIADPVPLFGRADGAGMFILQGRIGYAGFEADWHEKDTFQLESPHGAADSHTFGLRR